MWTSLWINELTGYYDGVFDVSDGYIENPKAILLKLASNNVLCIEFHPGDTIYYIIDEEIGCTDPDYIIRKISFVEFGEYTKTLNSNEKMLLLPMLKVISNEKEKVTELINIILCDINLKKCSFKEISMCILENCLG